MVTLLAPINGRVILSREEQPENAPSLMLVTKSGTTMFLTVLSLIPVILQAVKVVV